MLVCIVWSLVLLFDSYKALYPSHVEGFLHLFGQTVEDTKSQKVQADGGL